MGLAISRIQIRAMGKAGSPCQGRKAFLGSSRWPSFQPLKYTSILSKSPSATEKVTWRKNMVRSICSGEKGWLFPTEKSWWINTEGNRKSPLEHRSNNCFRETTPKDAKVSKWWQSGFSYSLQVPSPPQGISYKEKSSNCNSTEENSADTTLRDQGCHG